MTNKPKFLRLVSPKGVAVYPRLNTPSTKFKEEGEYSVKLTVPANEAVGYLEQIKAVAREFYKEQCSLLKKEKLKVHAFPWEEDGDKVTIKFSNVAKITAKNGQSYDLKVALLDSKGSPITDLIGAGSILKVAAEVKPWYVPALGVGVSLRLRAVQVIDLKAPTQLVSAQQFGFSTEEEGYVSGGESFDDSVFGKPTEQETSTGEPVSSGEEF